MVEAAPLALSITSAKPVTVVGQSGPSAGDIGGMLMAGVIVVVLGLAGVVVWRSEVGSSLFASAEPGDQTEIESPAKTVDPNATAETPPSGTAADAATGDSERTTKSDPDVVIDILEANDGRMKQARIVDETGWSKSKVSMVLSDMADEDEISKLRVGRENIISLSGNEPEAAGSPFDDEYRSS